MWHSIGVVLARIERWMFKALRVRQKDLVPQGSWYRKPWYDYYLRKKGPIARWWWLNVTHAFHMWNTTRKYQRDERMFNYGEVV